MQTTQSCPDNLPEVAEYIATSAALDALCARLEHSDFFALDTEFIRERTYLPRLCLLQVAAPALLAIVDPIALPDLEPLWRLLQQHSIIKVLHSGRQDLEVLYEHCGIVMAPLFDTQLAATLLGHGDQLGYGALVEARCGVTLDKAYTRTDWAARPLEPGPLRYAADDVRYLVPLYQQMRQQLEQDGRLHWLTEDCASLANPASYGTLPEDAWKRVRGAQSLRGRARQSLRQLAAWRERQARAEDRPRRWVVADELLVELAKHSPPDVEHLQRIRGMEAGVAHRYGHELLALLRTEGPVLPTFDPPASRHLLTVEQNNLVESLLAVVTEECTAHRVAVATLTSRRDLEALVLQRADIPLLHGWRRALAGQRVLDILKSG